MSFLILNILNFNLSLEGKCNSGGDWSCCNSNYKCPVGEGDCDYNSDCIGDLVCGTDNCGAGFLAGMDCCEEPPPPLLG